jgi:hypothetical protein
MTTAQQLMDKLEKTAKSVVIDKSRFSHLQYESGKETKEVWFYPTQAMNSDKTTILANDFDKAVYLLDNISTNNGLHLEFPDLHETKQACYARDTSDFFQNVLCNYRIHNGMMANKADKNIEIRKVYGVSFVDVPKPASEDIITDKEGKILYSKLMSNDTAVRSIYVADKDPLQRMSDYYDLDRNRFDIFTGSVPKPSERSAKGNGIWGRTVLDGNGLGVVVSQYGHVILGNFFYAKIGKLRVVDPIDDLVIPLFTREKP